MTFASQIPDWLAPGSDRLARLARLYAVGVLPLLALVLVVMGWPRADGLHDLSGATFGHDFSQVWIAGRTALAGNAAAVYDVAAHDQAQRVAFGQNAALFSWHYPPVFLMPAALLALLPYPAAVAAWGLGSAAIMAFALRMVLGVWRDTLVALAFPTIFDCLGYGQNGLLTAGLLTFGLLNIEARPYAAGALIGLVCYKPQLAALVFLVLLLSKHWRTALTLAAMAGLLALASVLAFGMAPWVAFVHGLSDTNADIFRESWAGLTLNASAFGAMRLLGASIGAAWMMQIVVSLAAGGFTLLAWRRNHVSGPLRTALLLAAIPLFSPYVPVYDLTLLVAAGSFLVVSARETGGLDTTERLAVITLFLIALDPRGFSTLTHVPFGFLLSLGVFALAARRVCRTEAMGCGALRPPRIEGPDPAAFRT